MHPRTGAKVSDEKLEGHEKYLPQRDTKSIALLEGTSDS